MSATESEMDAGGESDGDSDGGGNGDPPDGTWEAVRELPPSAKLVAKVLEHEQHLSQSELAEETLLSPRTVRYAVSRLEEVEAVNARFSFSDARKRIYSLDVE